MVSPAAPVPEGSSRCPTCGLVEKDDERPTIEMKAAPAAGGALLQRGIICNGCAIPRFLPLPSPAG
jgi:hypothetical protein